MSASYLALVPFLPLDSHFPLTSFLWIFPHLLTCILLFCFLLIDLLLSLSCDFRINICVCGTDFVVEVSILPFASLHFHNWFVNSSWSIFPAYLFLTTLASSSAPKFTSIACAQGLKRKSFSSSRHQGGISIYMKCNWTPSENIRFFRSSSSSLSAFWDWFVLWWCVVFNLGCQLFQQQPAECCTQLWHCRSKYWNFRGWEPQQITEL